MASPYATPVDQVFETLSTDSARGLSKAQVEQTRARHGFNELTEAPPVPRWKKFLGQFKELVIGILIVAAVIAGLLGEWIDALAILAIVLLNGVLGFLQEERAERALAALRAALGAAGQGPPRRPAAARCRPASSCPATGSSWRPATTFRPTARLDRRRSPSASRRRR